MPTRAEPRKLRITSLVLAAFLILAPVLMALAGTPVELNWTAGVLLFLSFVAAQKDAVFSDETAISESILVAHAAVGVAVGTGQLLIAFSCGLLGGVHLSHIRERSLTKIVINAGAIGLSALAAGAIAYGLGGASPNSLRMLYSGAVATCVFWVLNNSIIGFAISAAQGRGAPRTIAGLIRSEAEMLVFAFLGFLTGYLFVEVGTWAGTIGLVALLVLVDVAVIRRPPHIPKRRFFASVAQVALAGVVVVAAIVSAVVETFPDRWGFVALLGAMATAAVVMSRLPVVPGALPSTLAIVLAGAVFGAEAPIAAPLTAGVTMGIVACVLGRRRSILAASSELAAAGCGGLAAGIVFLELPLRETSSLPTFIGVVLAAGVAVVGARHLFLGAMLTARLGREARRVALELSAADIPSIAVTAVGGVLAWWAVRDGIEGSLLVVLAVAAVAFGVYRLGRTRWDPRTGILIEDDPVDPEELLTALRSTVLDCRPVRVREPTLELPTRTQ